MRLFLERGYDATTVQQIADDAGVSHMTFFRHFPTKEAVLLDDPYDDVIAAQVLAQDRGSAALERVRLGLLAAWAQLPEPASDEMRSKVRILVSTRSLMARAWENNRRTGDLVVDALVADGVDPFAARVATGACLGALMEALFDWGATTDARGLGDVVRRALDVLAPVPALPDEEVAR